MRSINIIILSFIIIIGCIEPYEFVVKNNKPTLVVEGYISNVSFNETLEYPSNGRYFNIKLSYTGDVINIRDEVVTNASVNLISGSGEEWNYTESSAAPGHYILHSENFAASAGETYKLQISLSGGKTYESDWERMPETAPKAIGSIGFEETTKQVYKIQAGEEVIETIQGVNVYMDLPPNELNNTTFYRWDFEPMWIYIAPLAATYEPDYKCWATNENYLSNYTLQIDHVGGYRKRLFFMETVRNERIFENFSVLVKQQAMSEGLYFFWKEMQEQVESNGFKDMPPYNLQTNIKSLDNDEKVSGYFGVINEKATRWYFNIEELSYYVKNTLRGDCLVDYNGPPAPACLSCLEYTNGTATNVEPVWWKDN